MNSKSSYIIIIILGLALAVSLFFNIKTLSGTKGQNTSKEQEEIVLEMSNVEFEWSWEKDALLKMTFDVTNVSQIPQKFYEKDFGVIDAENNQYTISRDYRSKTHPFYSYTDLNPGVKKHFIVFFECLDQNKVFCAAAVSCVRINGPQVFDAGYERIYEFNDVQQMKSVITDNPM